MKQFSGKLLAGLIATCALAGAPSQALAQSAAKYPTKPIHVIVNSPPGGGVDVVGRVVADRVMKSQKWTIVVENRAGAGGNIGSSYVAKSAADGYTLLLTPNNQNMNAFIYKDPGYHPRKDFVAVVQLTEAPSVFITGPKSPFKSLKNVVDAARAAPGKVVFGTSGVGTPTHAAGELLKKAAKINMTAVAYKGGALANQDVMGGQIPLGVAALPAVMGTIKAGKLRALAMTSEKRWPGLPDIPTAVESHPGVVHMTWIGALAPRGTPAPVIAQLNKEISAVLAIPEMRERIAGLGAQPVGKSSADFEAMLKADYEESGKLAKEIGLKLQ